MERLFFLGGDFAGGGLAAGMSAIACDFNGLARVAAILAAIFAVFHRGAGAGGMGALVLAFHNSPRSLCWMRFAPFGKGVIAEMGVADAIDDVPQTTESLAKITGAQPQALYRVLCLLASVGIFDSHNGRWQHTEASRLLRSDHPGSLRDYVRMLGMPVFWDAFADLHHSLRTGESAFTKGHPEGVFAYLAEHPRRAGSSTPP